MPIIIPKDLPAYEILEKESVFLMKQGKYSRYQTFEDWSGQSHAQKNTNRDTTA